VRHNNGITGASLPTATPAPNDGSSSHLVTVDTATVDDGSGGTRTTCASPRAQNDRRLLDVVAVSARHDHVRRMQVSTARQRCAIER
jgi:hypothetical protein